MKALSSSKRSKKSTLVIISGIVAVVLLGVGLYAYFTNKSQNLSANPQGTIKQEQVPSDSQSQSTLPSKTDENSSQSTPPPSTETPSTPPEKPSIERAGGDPTIKVVASFQKASSGYCELQISQPGQQTLSYTSTITVSTTYYTCSFSIARSKLPTGGSWKATIIHHIGTAATSSDAKDIE